MATTVSTYYSRRTTTAPPPPKAFSTIPAMASSSSANGTAASYYSHAVCRSSELESCARTALKLLQSQPPTPQTEWLHKVTPQQLHLHSSSATAVEEDSELSSLLEDGLSLLREMQNSLTKLQSLVRRRGHTNDPTNDIAAVIRRFETDAKELAEHVIPALTTITPERRGRGRHSFINNNTQTHKHLQYVASWLQAVAARQTAKLKELLQVRSAVLADQAQRRKLLNPQHHHGSNKSTNNHSNNNTSGTSLPTTRPSAAAAAAGVASNSRSINNNSSTPWASPLFTATAAQQPTQPQAPSSAAARLNTNGSGPYNQNVTTIPSTTLNGTNSFSAAASQQQQQQQQQQHPYHRSASAGGGYGGGGGASSYYGAAASYGGSASMGMRQRRGGAAPSAQNNNNTNNNDDSNDDAATTLQSQIQQRQVQRQTQNRLESARQAERSLAELGTLFGKMSSLIVQQGETLEKVEDDVEAALGDVTAGQEEITKLHALKRGNRALILKVFAVLIFFILFMRLY